MKKKLFFLSFIISLLIILFICFYNLGKGKGKEDCLKEKIETKVETIEVIKHISNKESEIYSRPSSDFEQLLLRMERNEL